MEVNLWSDVFAASHITFQESDPLRPEKNLATAILERAIKDAGHQFDIPPRNPERCAEEALRWIHSEDASPLFSFLAICEHLDYEPQCMRKAIDRLVSERPGRVFTHRKDFSYSRAREKTLKVA